MISYYHLTYLRPGGINISQDQSALNKNDLEKAIKTFRKELETHKIKRNKKGAANTHVKLGILNSMKGEVKNAFEEYEKALEICEETSDDNTKATCFGNMGILLFSQGNNEKAEKLFLDASELHEKLGRKEELASDHINLGLLFSKREDYKLALDSYQKAISIIEEQKDYELLADVSVKIAHCHNRTGRLLEAVAYYEKALKNFKKAGLPDFEGAVNGILENKLIIALSRYNEKKELGGDAFQDAISILTEFTEKQRIEILITHLKHMLGISADFVDTVFERIKILGDNVYGSLVPFKFAALAQKSQDKEAFLKELDPQIQGIVMSILKSIEGKDDAGEEEHPEIV